VFRHAHPALAPASAVCPVAITVVRAALGARLVQRLSSLQRRTPTLGAVLCAAIHLPLVAAGTHHENRPAPGASSFPPALLGASQPSRSDRDAFLPSAPKPASFALSGDVAFSPAEGSGCYLGLPCLSSAKPTG
jgi:hypothetical protein